MAEELRGRNVDARDEQVAETPWGPDIPVHRAAPLSPGIRAAIQRYRLARAALRANRDIDGPDEAIDPVTPIAPLGSIRNNRI